MPNSLHKPVTGLFKSNWKSLIANKQNPGLWAFLFFYDDHKEVRGGEEMKKCPYQLQVLLVAMVRCIVDSTETLGVDHRRVGAVVQEMLQAAVQRERENTAVAQRRQPRQRLHQEEIQKDNVQVGLLRIVLVSLMAPRKMTVNSARDGTDKKRVKSFALLD